jgi:hypothetical protein
VESSPVLTEYLATVENSAIRYACLPHVYSTLRSLLCRRSNGVQDYSRRILSKLPEESDAEEEEEQAQLNATAA